MKEVPTGEPGRLELRKAFGVFPSGLVGICALVEGSPVGMVASTFIPVSLDPPLVGFCAQLDSVTWPLLEPRPRIGVSVLGESHDLAARRLGSDGDDQFEDLTVVTTAGGALMIEGAGAWLECSLYSQSPAGDHTFVLLRIESFEVRPGEGPLIFHSSTFRRLSL
jgi:flavin reductase (DIM6/NTAB) family NADH-FMN oxidoreductase RutF